MKLVLKSDEVAGQVTQSVVFQIAEKAKNIKGCSIFGPVKGIQPGALRPFEMIEGPGNMVQWESRCGSKPITTCSKFKWGYIAVVNDDTYKLICKMEEDPVQGEFTFTYNAPYVDL
jgi:hypothetical protein